MTETLNTISKKGRIMGERKEDRFFMVVVVAGSLLLNAVVFGYLYGILETKVASHERTLTSINLDIKRIPERLTRIEVVLQQLVDKARDPKS